jgi:assimilatory nitrate reductase electron transfer subunit
VAEPSTAVPSTAARSTAAPTRVVLIGYGPVGARFVEELLPSVRLGHVALTVIGAEEEGAYNRVLLAEYAVGRADRVRLELLDSAVVVESGVILRLGDVATSINRTRQRVSLGSGETIPYDRLVLATGARANIPTLAGLESTRIGPATSALDAAAELPRGVVVLRDLADADVVRASVEAGQHVVLLGAGVLGMELALAAREQGATVTVVYHGEAPMARNLDQGGGRMLARAAEATGVRMVGHSRGESVLQRTGVDGHPVFDALVCADGKQIAGDLLVLSCGVGARVELAGRAGLAVSRGVLVDEELRSWSDPDIFAIGDCAHIAPRAAATGSAPDAGGDLNGRTVPGGPSGLIGPGWRQADWLAAAFAAEAGDAPRTGILAEEREYVVMLKSDGVHVVSAGDVTADPWDDTRREVSQWIDPGRGHYVKMITHDDVLTGFVCAGMPRTGAELTLLFERGSELPADRSVLLGFDAVRVGSTSSQPPSPDQTVCWCNGVSAGAITECAALGHTTVEAVGAATRAGTGCGGCKGRIAQLLAAAQLVATSLATG